MTDSNTQVGSFQGNPSGDVSYLFLAFTTYRIVATTCSTNTLVDTLIRVYGTTPVLPIQFTVSWLLVTHELSSVSFCSSFLGPRR